MPELHLRGTTCALCTLRDAVAWWRDTPVCNVCKEILSDA